jgi:hypothetical protein
MEGDFLVFPGGCIIPEDLLQLPSEGTCEDHAARCPFKPEDKFFHRFSGWVEFLRSDFFDGHGGRTFEVTATGKTAGVKL